LVSIEVLAYSVRWEHRLGADGVSVDVTLADGRRIRDDSTRGVLNRLMWVPPQHLLAVHPDDRDYVAQELNAFYLSWLHALPCPVLNRPTPQGLAGQWRHVSEWVWLASTAGLSVPDYRHSSGDVVAEMGAETKLVPIGTPVKTIMVVGGHVVGASAPPDVLEGCQRLAKLSTTELLGVEFAPGSAGPWTFAGATPWPDLRLGGADLLDVLADALRGDGERSR
jgi:hypothetical protein